MERPMTGQRGMKAHRAVWFPAAGYREFANGGFANGVVPLFLEFPDFVDFPFFSEIRKTAEIDREFPSKFRRFFEILKNMENQQSPEIPKIMEPPHLRNPHLRIPDRA